MAVEQPALSDLSELEMQQEPLSAGAAGKREGLKLWGKAPVIAAVTALLGAAALVAVLRASPAPGPRPVAGPGADTIQAYALAQGGRTLTEDELAQVRRYAARAGGSVVGRFPGGLHPRLLEDEDHEHDHDFNISQECQEGMAQLGKDVLAKVVQLGLQAFTKCQEDEHSDECTAAKTALENFEDDLKKECRTKGAMCTMTEHTPDGQESEDQCMPKACHQHADVLEHLATDELNEEREDCDDCKVTVDCGSSGDDEDDEDDEDEED